MVCDDMEIPVGSLAQTGANTETHSTECIYL